MEMDQVEKERAAETKPASLDLAAFEAAWEAYQNNPIDVMDDTDNETCRCLGAGIVAYLAAARG